MRRHLVVFTSFAVSTATLFPLTQISAQNNNSISINDFAQGQRGVALTATAPLRRGVTSRVVISKDLIDLVSFNDISLSGGGSMTNLTNGRNVNGMGMISMDITVPAGQTLGQIMTLKVGLIDQFKFSTVSRGQVTNVTRNPEPSTIPATTPWIVTVAGTDMGSVEVAPINCHTIVYSNRSANGVTATLTRNASCSTSAFGVAWRGSATTDPPSFNLANGNLAGFQFQYAPSGVACVSQPNIGAPTVRQPQTGQVIQFNSGTLSPASVTIAWDSLLTSNTTAPNNEFVVTHGEASTIGLTATRSVSTTTTGRSTIIRFPIPGRYSVTVKAKNCGQSAPSTTVTFSTQYQ
jgi:hypothetical protein